MPRVLLPADDSVKCGFKTTAAAWRRWPTASAAYEAACKAVLPEVIRTVDARCVANELLHSDFWPTVRREIAARIAEQANQPADPGASAVPLAAQEAAPVAAEPQAAAQPPAPNAAAV